MILFPDILGYATHDQRVQQGAVQFAAAVRPFAVRAGQPFDVVVMLQNTVDVVSTVQVTIQVPKADQKNQPDRFVAKSTAIAVDLKPGEVGVAVVPVATLPNVAVGSGYELDISVTVQAKQKGNAVRDEQGGVPFESYWANETLLAELDTLRQQKFVVEMRRHLRGRTLHPTFNVMPGGISKLNMSELQPHWDSLWTMADIHHMPLLVEMYRTPLAKKMIPKLNREVMFKPLALETQRRFTASGFPLDPSELALITKLLALILEFAHADETGHGNLTAQHFNLWPLVEGLEQSENPQVPYWFRAMLDAMQVDNRVASVPEQSIPKIVYPELIRDAVSYGFQQVEGATGRVFGTPEELEQYAEHLVDTLTDETRKLHFAQVYMPLVLGGLVVFDRMTLPNERADALLVNLSHVVMARRERFENTRNKRIFETSAELLERTLARYGGGRRY